MRRSRRRRISTRHSSTRRPTPSGSQRTRSGAPLLKNILSQLGGLAAGAPWHKRRSKRALARRPKSLRVEGLERREMLTVQGDIDLAYAESQFGSRIGPAYYPNTQVMSAPLSIFESGLSFSGDIFLPQSFNLHYSIESDMQLGVDYRFYVHAIATAPAEISDLNGVVTVGNGGSASFDIKFLRDLGANEEHYVRVTLLDSDDYDVPGSAGYSAPVSYSSAEFTNSETWYNLETRVAYFRGASDPSTPNVPPVVDCDCGCLCAGDTKADAKEETGAATVTHKLSGSDQGNPGDASAPPLGVLSFNSAALTSPTVRGYDLLPSYLGDLPNQIEVMASYYELNSMGGYDELVGTRTTSFFTTDYAGAQFGTNSGVQYALNPDASDLSTGVYKWKMKVTYHYDDFEAERTQDLQGWQLILNDAESVFGKGWQFSEAPSLTVQDDGKIILLRQGQNARAFYHVSGDNYDSGVGGEGLTLDGNIEDGFEYTDKYGTKYSYNSAGHLLYYTDRNDNKTEYHYADGPGVGQLQYILYPNGRRTKFEYDGGYVSRIIENALDDGSGGTSTWLDIDANGHLVSIIGEDADGQNYGLPAPVTTIEYVDNSDLVKIVKRNIVSPLTPTETTFEQTTYSYHLPSGTVTSVLHHSGEGCNCGASTMQLFAAQRWGAADPTITEGGYAQGTEQNPAPLRAIGAPQGSMNEQISDTEWRTSAFTIDGFGQIASRTVSPGTADAATTIYHRNAEGLVWRMIEADPDGAGPQPSPITIYEYDDDTLNLESITLPNGQSQEWLYGAFNQVVQFTDELGRVTIYDLDVHGNVEVMQQVVGAPNTLEDQGDDLFTKYEYTAAPNGLAPGTRMPGGLVTKITDPLGNDTQYTYYRADSSEAGTAPVDPDLVGLLQEITFAAGSTDEATVQFGYDTHRRLTSQTDERQRTTDYAYDAQNRVVSITQPDADSGDSLGRPVTTFAYDTLGRLARQVDPDPDAPSAGRDPHWTEYHYSDNDRTLIVRETPRESGGAVIQTVYKHDMLGRLIKVTDPLNHVTEYTYTDHDEVATVKLPAASSGAPVPVYSYTYDQLGRLTQVTRPSPAARTAPTPHALAEVEATELDLQSVITLFDPASPASAAFVDTVDADGALRYEIVGVDGTASFFKSLRFAANGGRQLILDYAEFTGADTATVTLRATNTAGLSSELEIEVTRSAVNTSAQTVNTTTSGDQLNSSVAAFADEAGGYVVVWEGAGPSGSGSDDHGIWFQRFDKSGNKVGSQTLVNTSTTGVQGKPMVAASNDGFAVAWYDYVNSTAAQIRWRTFDRSGGATSAEKSYWSNIAVPLGGPAIARLLPTEELPDSRYVVTWALRGVTELGDDVYGQVVDADGDGISNVFRANPASPGAQQRPSIAPTKDGGFIIAWDGDGSFGSTSTATDAIFLRRFQADGTAPWVETRVDLTNDISSYAATSDGGLVVVWQDQPTSGSDAVIKGRRFAADGTPASSEFEISAGPDIPTGYSHERPSVAGTADGGFVVAWDSNNPSNNQVNFRRYDRFGAPIAHSATGATLATSPVDIVSGPGGGIFMTWTHVSGGQADVKAQLARLPFDQGSEPAILQIESVTPGQSVIGAVDSFLVTFNKTTDTSLNLSVLTLTKPDGTSITTGFSAAQVSTTQFLISLPAAQNAVGEYHLAIDSSLVSELDAGVIMAFTIVAPADQAGGTIDYAYDSLGRVVETTDTAGAVTRYAYTPQSDGELQITESRFLPSNLTTPYSTTTYDYNALGQLVLVTLPLVAGLGAAPTIAYGYDKNGNLLRTTDPRGAKTDYRYDARGRLIRRYDPNADSGESVDGNDDPLGPATQYIYTDANELEEVIGPAILGPSGTIAPHTFYEYDGLGRLKKVTSGKPVDGQLVDSPIFTSYQYDQVGNLISMTEPASGVTPLDGRAPTAALTTTFSYDTQSNLTRVTLPNPTTDYSGAAPHVDYAYDDLARRTGVIDELGRHTDYLYDNRGNLTTVIEANPANAADTSLTSAARPKYQFTYDLADNLLVETDPLGRATQYRFDAAGRITHQIDALGGVSFLGYDALSRQTSQLDALGRRTDFAFDALDQLRLVTEANPLLPGQTGYSSTGRPEHEYQYDAAGNLVTYTDPLDRVTDYTFDKLGRLTDVDQPEIDSSRPNTHYAYDDSGNLTTVTDPMSRVTSFWHDGLGRLAQRRDPDPTTLGGSGGQLTTYGYDNRSQLVLVRQPEPGSSQFIDTNFDYDAAGRVLRETLPEVAESYTNGIYASAHRTALTYGYDLAGQLTSFKDQMNLETTYAYDALGRQTTKTVISPRGTYDPDHDIVTSFAYDAVGNQTKVTDPIGAVTFTAYDSLNRVTSVMDAREGITRFGFDAVGNQTSLVDAAGNVNRWAFDRLNRLSSDTDPLGKTRFYGYDQAGNLTSQVDRNGHQREFLYDALDRRTEERWIEDGTSTVTRTLSWQYDLSGKLTDTDDRFSAGSVLASAHYQYHYDAGGRLDKSLSTLAGLASNQTVFQTHTRDTLGRRTGLATTLGGTFSASTFTVSGGTADLANTYVYDKQDRLRRVIQTTPSSDAASAYKRVDLMYNDRGQISTIYRQAETAGNYRVNSYYTYDGLGRQRSQLDYLPASGWDGPNYNWGYDDANRLITEWQSFKPINLGYAYDATGQITGTNSDTDAIQPDAAYVHDLAGNRQNVGDSVGLGNQLLEDADFEYTYDAEGNRATRTRKSGASSTLPALTTYEYDFRQRLVRVTICATDETPTTAVEYGYDTLDRRISRREIHFESDGETIDTQSTEYFVYDEGQTRAYSGADGALGGVVSAVGSGDVLFDFYDADGSGTSSSPTLHRRYLAALDRVFAQENLFVDDSVSNTWNPNGAPIGTYWLIADRLGTVRNVIDNNRVIWNHAQYDAYGNRLSLDYPHTDPATPLARSITRYGFTGQEYDETTGLTWYSNGKGRGRWYDARTNTFIQPDAIGVVDGPHVYAYTHNGPTNFTDPNGQAAVDEWIDNLPPQTPLPLSPEHREALRFGFYATLLKLERDALLARARSLKEQIARWEAIGRTTPLCPGSRGGNMFAGMKKELAAIESRFAENLAQASQLAELFEDAGFGELEFGVMVPHDEIHFKEFGSGLAGAQRYADWLLTQWSGNAGGALQPSWDPIEAFAAVRGAWGLARGAISMGRSAVAFGKNVRDLSRLLSRISDDLLKELDDAAKRLCIETHHNLPQAQRFRKYFDRAGLNIEDYTEPMTRGRHRLKPDGVHTGPTNWNKQWAEFFKKHPDATREQILAELDRIRGSFGMGPWQGGR